MLKVCLVNLWSHQRGCAKYLHNFWMRHSFVNPNHGIWNTIWSITWECHSVHRNFSRTFGPLQQIQDSPTTTILLHYLWIRNHQKLKMFQFAKVRPYQPTADGLQGECNDGRRADVIRLQRLWGRQSLGSRETQEEEEGEAERERRQRRKYFWRLFVKNSSSSIVPHLFRYNLFKKVFKALGQRPLYTWTDFW